MGIEKSIISEAKLILIIVSVVILGTLFGAMGYLLGTQNNNKSAVIKSENQEMDRDIEIKEDAKNNNENVKDKMADWSVYKNEEYGVSFKYPSDFKIKTDKIEHEFSSGKNWYRIELENLDILEKPHFILEINPDGYGPFWPNKRYEISENTDGTINILSEKEEKSEYSDNGRFLIIPSYIKSQNGNSYSSRFSFVEGGENYENVYKNILKSIRIIIKDEMADWSVYKNEEYGVSFKYPQEAEIVEENKNRIDLPIVLENDVSEKYLLINNEYANGECSNPLSTKIKETEIVIINNTDFTREIGSDSAAGSVYYSVSYSTLRDNRCLGLSFVVRSHNYNIDRNSEYEIFNQIISTFEFIESSDETVGLELYNGKLFSFNYSSELWNLNDNGHFSNTKIGSCEFSFGGLFRQSMSNILETEKIYFGEYEARKTKIGNDTDGVVRINVYFDADPSSEFSLFLPKNENDKQTCENDFDAILSTINFL